MKRLAKKVSTYLITFTCHTTVKKIIWWLVTKLTNADCKGFRAKLNNSDIQHLIINPGEKEPKCKLS
jgi:hypothetical protein